MTKQNNAARVAVKAALCLNGISSQDVIRTLALQCMAAVQRDLHVLNSDTSLNEWTDNDSSASFCLNLAGEEANRTELAIHAGAEAESIGSFFIRLSCLVDLIYLGYSQKDSTATGRTLLGLERKLCEYAELLDVTAMNLAEAAGAHS